MKNYKIQKKYENHYCVYIAVKPTFEEWIGFIFNWFLTFITVGLYVGFIIITTDDGLTGFKVPHTKWGYVKFFKNLESATEYVEQQKEYAKEVYYL